MARALLGQTYLHRFLGFWFIYIYIHIQHSVVSVEQQHDVVVVFIPSDQESLSTSRQVHFNVLILMLQHFFVCNMRSQSALKPC